VSLQSEPPPHIDEHGGDSTSPTLVLLHGLGATADVWRPLLDTCDWPGRIVAPDLRGHGSAEWRDRYSFGAMATDVAAVLAHNEPFVVLGHSLGGVVGLALASGSFGPPPLGVATLGIKIRWTEEEVGRLPGLAARPPRRFAPRAEAADWVLKLAGLYGFAAADDSVVDRGVIEENHPDGDWRAAQDPRSVLVGAPNLMSLLGAVEIPLAMALGVDDPLVEVDHHLDLDRELGPHVFEAVGHNAMFEKPEAVWDWFRSLPFS
jgi:pimeloyl-ACP methyl ester carboxylesterase